MKYVFLILHIICSTLYFNKHFKKYLEFFFIEHMRLTCVLHINIQVREITRKFTSPHY